ncbi:MAG: DM13 domain-containing protein [Candidatus Peribacteraceae bacterium]|nr:DM13 domain-containing protein [Candidatus Peribacteraceae bacterium]
MLKKILIAIIAALILAFAWWTISPLFYDRVVDEPLSDLVDVQPESIQLNEDVEMREAEVEDVAEQMQMEAEPVEPVVETEAQVAISEAETPAAKPAPEQAALEEISRGQFEGADGHTASGTVLLLRRGDTYFLRFEDDFDSANAPDVFVHFGRDGAYAPEARVAELKGNRGSQNYEVPAEINIADYNEVWTWCRAFSVGIARAELNE